MAKMRILILSTAYFPFVGGAEVAIKEITDRLPLFDFELITARLDKNLPKEERVGNVLVHRIGRGSKLDKLALPFLGVIKIFKLSKQRRFDLFWPVMATYASGAAYIYNLLTFWKKIPTILNLQEGDSEDHLEKRHWGLIDLSWRLALPLSTHVTAISHYLGKRAQRLGFDREYKLIPNGVSKEFLNVKLKKNERKELRASLGYSEEDYVIITTGRLVHKNAVDECIRAFAYLPPRVKFLSIGDGAMKSELVELVKQYNLSERVKFLPFMNQTELAKHLAMADVFVRPSRSEGLGNSFLEAMAVGLPTIGTAVGGIPDFLMEGGTGFICEVGSPHSIAEKIQLTMVNKSLVAEVIKNAKNLIQSSYKWESIAASYQELFLSEAHRLLVVTPIYPPAIGGPATHTQFIEEEFPKLKTHVETVSYTDLNHLPAGFSNIAFAFKILFASFRADTVYALDPVGVGLPAAIISKIFRKRFILRVAGDRAWETAALEGFKDNLDGFILSIEQGSKQFSAKVRLYIKIERKVAKMAYRVIVPGQYLVRVMRKWGVDPSDVVAISNPVDIPPKISKIKERKKRNLSGKIIISAGRLVPWKGFVELVEASSVLRKDLKDLSLYIAGDGPERQNIRNKIHSLDLDGSVFLLGNLPKQELNEYITLADCFVLNTTYEGFSHQILEAQALGTPIVATNIEANRALVEDGETGFLINPQDQAQLKGAIARILTDHEIAKEMSQRAKERSLVYAREKISKDLFDVIYKSNDL